VNKDEYIYTQALWRMRLCLQAAELAGLRGSGSVYLLSVSVTNLMQTFWFGANFLLYCGCALGRGGHSASTGSGSNNAGEGLLRGRGRGRGKGTNHQLRELRAVTSSPLITTAI